MRKRRRMLAVLLVGGAAGLTLGNTFVWVGQGADHRWDTCTNWAAILLPDCYPDDSQDHALVPYSASTWPIDLITVGPIAELTVRGNTSFQPATPGTQMTLRTFKLTIDTQNAGADVTVTVSGTAKIETVPLP